MKIKERHKLVYYSNLKNVDEAQKQKTIVKINTNSLSENRSEMDSLLG